MEKWVPNVESGPVIHLYTCEVMPYSKGMLGSHETEPLSNTLLFDEENSIPRKCLRKGE